MKNQDKPAFVNPYSFDTEPGVYNTGLTKLEYASVRAMYGMLSCEKLAMSEKTEKIKSIIASESIELAEELLKQLDGKTKTTDKK